MPVLIDNQQNKYRIALERLKKQSRAILSALGSPEAELSLVIVDDPQIAVLNEKYLQHPGPTNVIAFPMREGPFGDVTQLLGDVVISVETAHRESQAAGILLEERLTQLLVHGILHLFGYDHEQDDAQRQEMEQKSDELVKLLEDPAIEEDPNAL